MTNLFLMIMGWMRQPILILSILLKAKSEKEHTVLCMKLKIKGQTKRIEIASLKCCHKNNRKYISNKIRCQKNT